MNDNQCTFAFDYFLIHKEYEGPQMVILWINVVSG